MQKRKLGKSNLEALGLGCMGMSFSYGPFGGKLGAVSVELAAGDLNEINNRSWPHPDLRELRLGRSGEGGNGHSQTSTRRRMRSNRASSAKLR